jgi:hypothetical protein
LGDNGSQVPASDGGCWHINIASGGYDVRIWGAVCNGSTDDTASVAAAKAFSATLIYPSDCIVSGSRVPQNMLIQRTTTGVPSSGSAVVPTVYISGIKTGTAGGDRATGLYSEGVDSVGGDGTFVEGGRFHGTVAGNNGQADGLVCLAQNLAGVSWDYLIGCESATEVANSDTAWPPLGTITTPVNVAIGFLATNAQATTSHVATAGFATNAYSGKPFHAGFYVMGNSAKDAAFKSDASASIGLDLSGGANGFAAIELPNNSKIRFKGGGGADLNVMHVPSGSNTLILGTDTQGITLPATTVPSPGPGFSSIYMDSTDSKLKAKAPDGTVTVVGPTGGVSCAAGTVSLSTLVVTNGVVTHC